jgi:hypothetical protein
MYWTQYSKARAMAEYFTLMIRVSHRDQRGRIESVEEKTQRSLKRPSRGARRPSLGTNKKAVRSNVPRLGLEGQHENTKGYLTGTEGDRHDKSEATNSGEEIPPRPVPR